MGKAQSIGRSPAEAFGLKGVGEAVVVQTLKGKIQGFRPRKGGAVHFRGVPVAAPTTGATCLNACVHVPLNESAHAQARHEWQALTGGRPRSHENHGAASSTAQCKALPL